MEAPAAPVSLWWMSLAGNYWWSYDLVDCMHVSWGDAQNWGYRSPLTQYEQCPLQTSSVFSQNCFDCQVEQLYRNSHYPHVVLNESNNIFYFDKSIHICCLTYAVCKINQNLKDKSLHFVSYQRCNMRNWGIQALKLQLPLEYENSTLFSAFLWGYWSVFFFSKSTHVQVNKPQFSSLGISYLMKIKWFCLWYPCKMVEREHQFLLTPGAS